MKRRGRRTGVALLVAGPDETRISVAVGAVEWASRLAHAVAASVARSAKQTVLALGAICGWPEITVAALSVADGLVAIGHFNRAAILRAAGAFTARAARACSAERSATTFTAYRTVTAAPLRDRVVVGCTGEQAKRARDEEASQTLHDTLLSRTRA